VVSALVTAARDQAEALTERLANGHTSLADYNQAIATSGARLAEPLDAPGLADLLAQMGEATQRMQAANAVLMAELDLAVAESRGLARKLLDAERAAVTDVLTGVLNRRGSVAAIEQAQARSRDDGTPLALAVVDIDHFKRFNDRYGHAMGDDVLRFVAQHLASRLADRGGSVGRLGGEEFVLLLPGDAIGPATGLVDRIRAELAGQVLRSATDGSSMGRISFSAGVAQDKPADTTETLLERADKALYTAKRMGRDRVIPGHN
jgi:diguanylate cyclase